MALGGDYARVRTDSAVVGKGATSNLLAVYFGDGQSMHDFRTMQDPVAPATTSDLLFKGAVRDEAKSVYSGLIRVRKCLLDAALALRAQETPPPGLDPASYRVRPASVLLPKDVPWVEGAKERLVAHPPAPSGG